jgi:uncharacterized protein (TIGR02391 family)
MVAGPYANLLTTYPTREAWLAADPEEMGLVLLRDLKAHSTSGFCPQNILGLLRERYSHDWGGGEQTGARIAVVFEAYQWLRNVGFIVPSAAQPRDFDTLSRRARTLDEAGLDAFRATRLSGYDILDSRITDKVWSIYLRGDYDIAIGYAFKVVEVRMREKAGLTTNDMGERLAKKFFATFDSEARKKSERALPSVVLLCVGALDRYRNSAVHEYPTITDPDEAMEVLLLANHCLRVVERSTTTAP